MYFQQKGKNTTIFVFIFIMLGVITANPLFYVVGALIAFIVLFDLAVFLAAVDAMDASIMRKVSKNKLYLDNSLDVEINLNINNKNLKNIYFHDIYPDAFMLLSGDAVQKIDTGKSGHRISYSLKAIKRGNHSFSDPYLDVESNFHMFKHKIDLDCRTEVVIYPPVLTKKSIIARYISSQFGRSRSRQKGTGVEVAEVRNYIPGDDFRHIDWKTSLRLNSLFSKEFESDTELPLFVLVDHSRTDNSDNLDYTVRIANYLAQQAARNNQPSGMITFTHDRITNKTLIKKGKNQFEMARNLFSLGLQDSKPCSIAMDIAEIKEFERKLKSSNSEEFYSILAPFFIDNPEHLRIIESQGIYQAIKHVISFSNTPSLIAIITDLAYDAPMLESIRLATYYGNKVILVVTSSLLFREYDVLGLEGQYVEYIKLQKKIEKFRRLKGIKIVEAGQHETPELLINQVVSGWKASY
ncbi:Uncharacterised protein [uncultured archaeon]|nr:Uncharacterised protein [uncultured archaeon]